MRKRIHVWTGPMVLSLTLAAGVLVCGCAVQKQARSVEESGFLGDYSLLRKGGQGEALLNYRNPDADWASYDKILLEPVVFYQKVKDPSRGTPPQDIQAMVDDFSSMIHTELAKDYTMVGEPGPGVMRIQVGLTNVEKSHAGLQTVTSMIPVGIAVSTTRNLITGKPSFVGEASIEIRITDAQNGAILGEAVDRRVGGQMIKTSLSRWVDVNNILAQWSKLFRFRLCRLRGQADCEKP